MHGLLSLARDCVFRLPGVKFYACQRSWRFRLPNDNIKIYEYRRIYQDGPRMANPSKLRSYMIPVSTTKTFVLITISWCSGHAKHGNMDAH